MRYLEKGEKTKAVRTIYLQNPRILHAPQIQLRGYGRLYNNLSTLKSPYCLFSGNSRYMVHKKQNE